MWPAVALADHRDMDYDGTNNYFRPHPRPARFHTHLGSAVDDHRILAHLDASVIGSSCLLGDGGCSRAMREHGESRRHSVEDGRRLLRRGVTRHPRAQAVNLDTSRGKQRCPPGAVSDTTMNEEQRRACSRVDRSALGYRCWRVSCGAWSPSHCDI